MKSATLISAIITTLLMMTTMICGLWMKANNISDAGSLSFHINCGITSVVFSFITMLLLIIFLLRLKRQV
jgi:hypothetical protein